MNLLNPKVWKVLDNLDNYVSVRNPSHSHPQFALHLGMIPGDLRLARFCQVLKHDTLWVEYVLSVSEGYHKTK